MKFLPWLIGWLLVVSLGSPLSSAAKNPPLSTPNNRYGVHILDPLEIDAAAKLVNSSGGLWGYVTIPIRSDDRDPIKWSAFFRRAGQLKVIPIIRLATFVYQDTWAAPTAYDLVDYANFLSDMPWPTKNRYIILFNEPNHAKEWGGTVDPAAYATLLIQAKAIFSSRSSDYFLLTGGLDMSAPTNRTSLDALSFYRRMTLAQPHWLDAIDGLSFHAYPNPAFSSPVSSTTRYGILSFRHELDFLQSLRLTRTTSLPVFITETGHLGQPHFFSTAFNTVWTDPNLVAITPFLLFAGTGDFSGFSLLDPAHQPTSSYQDIFALPKTAGSPLLGVIIPVSPTPTANPDAPTSGGPIPLLTKIKDMLFTPNPGRQLTIGATTLTVDIADTDALRAHGLSDRTSLPPLSGMLFTFPAVHRPNFWMHGMLFGLDFVWINSGKVVGITENIPPPAATNNQPLIVRPDVFADWILEVPAGFIAAHGIKVGDEVVLSP